MVRMFLLRNREGELRHPGINWFPIISITDKPSKALLPITEIRGAKE